MSIIKPIKDGNHYEEAIQLLTELIESNPAVDSAEDVQIHVLTSLIEDYENKNLPDYAADPIESIKFRMDQLGLKDKDLVPFLGTRSRVSEVLSGKRALTVSMIQNLEQGLGIPASSLIGGTGEKNTKRWSSGILSLMAKRGYFGKENQSIKPAKILELGLLREIINPNVSFTPVLLRQSSYREVSNIDKYYMQAWSNKVIDEAKNILNNEKIPKFEIEKLNEDELSSIFKLSEKSDGVLAAISKLKQFGILVIIEPHLPGTLLDGATFFTEQTAVIGITLRYDRLDSFWFTLAHELSHVYLHSNLEIEAFYDRLFTKTDELTEIEKAADKFAGNLLIPEDTWKITPLRYGSTPTLVEMFAKQIGVHKSVVAGRIRHDSGDWTVHADLVHEEQVRSLFKDVTW